MLFAAFLLFTLWLVKQSAAAAPAKKKKKSFQTNLSRFDFGKQQLETPLCGEEGAHQQHELKHLCGCTISSANINLVPSYVSIILLNKCIICSPHTLSDCSNLQLVYSQFSPNMTHLSVVKLKKGNLMVCSILYDFCEFTLFRTENTKIIQCLSLFLLWYSLLQEI